MEQDHPFRNHHRIGGLDGDSDMEEREIEVNKALERLKPKKVVNTRKNAFEEHFGNCPTCNDVVNDYGDKHYCRLCGQALDWSK